MKNKHFSSRMMTLSGGIMTLSGLLMVLSGRVAVGGVFWAAASCMFFTARIFRMAENKKDTEETKNGKETV